MAQVRCMRVWLSKDGFPTLPSQDEEPTPPPPPSRRASTEKCHPENRPLSRPSCSSTFNFPLPFFVRRNAAKTRGTLAKESIQPERREEARLRARPSRGPSLSAPGPIPPACPTLIHKGCTLPQQLQYSLLQSALLPFSQPLHTRKDLPHPHVTPLPPPVLA
jgi:hypothetical protein